MGNKQTKGQLENAAKTGVCNLSNRKFEELPNELFKLDKLRSLDISSNRIARYPPGIQSLVNLKVLNVSSNRFTSITVIKLRKLENLNARGNLLCEFPSLTHCDHLKTLDLSFNKIKELPPNLSELRALGVLDLRHNLIENIDNA